MDRRQIRRFPHVAKSSNDRLQENLDGKSGQGGTDHWSGGRLRVRGEASPPDLQLRDHRGRDRRRQLISVSTEVQQHLGENRVRCVSMQPTDGMVRGMKAIDTGQPISVPVGRETLGRVMNVIGKPVDRTRRGECRQELSHPSPCAQF